MDAHDFTNGLRILHSLDSFELVGMPPNKIANFMTDPARFLVRCDDETQAIIWKAVESRQKPKRVDTSISEIDTDVQSPSPRI